MNGAAKVFLEQQFLLGLGLSLILLLHESWKGHFNLTVVKAAMFLAT